MVQQPWAKIVILVFHNILWSIDVNIHNAFGVQINQGTTIFVASVKDYDEFFVNIINIIMVFQICFRNQIDINQAVAIAFDSKILLSVVFERHRSCTRQICSPSYFTVKEPFCSPNIGLS